MQSLIAAIYAYWQKIPAGVRAGITLLVLGVVAAGFAFGWHFPTSWVDAKEQVAAFWLVVVPIAYGIFQKSIWPPLFAWILVLLGLAPTVEGKQLITAWKPE